MPTPAPTPQERPLPGGVTASGERSIAASEISVATAGDHSPVDARTTVLAAGDLRSPGEVDAPLGCGNLPRPPAPVFVGRDDALAVLDGVLAAGGASAVVTQTVYGLGGVGKSELVLHHAHAHHGGYRLVWWITADTPERLEAGLAALAERLHPVLALAGTAQVDAAGWEVGWLQSHQGWLLVLDNVEDPAHVRPLLGHLYTGHIVITTRRDVAWPGSTIPIRLDLLTLDAAVELITCTTGRRQAADVVAARQIAAELGLLPLALGQAAAYITQTRISPDRYLTKLRSQPARMYAATAEGGDAERTIARLWDLHLGTLRQHAPGAVELLEVLAHYATDDIPRTILPHTTGTDGEVGADVDELLGVLASYSMINLTEETVSLHRLMQTVLLTQPPAPSPGVDSTPDPQPTARDTALRWLDQALPTAPGTNTAGWTLYRALIPHVDAITSRYPTGHEPQQLSRVFNEVALFENVHGFYDRALTRRLHALAITETALGPDHPETATRLGNLASTYSDLGRHTDALPLQERALAITETALGPDHPTTALRLGNLAVTYQALGRHTDALATASRAYTCAIAVLGAEHPTTRSIVGFLQLLNDHDPTI